MSETETERNQRVAQYWRKAYLNENESEKTRDLPYEPTAVLQKPLPSRLRVSRDGYLILNSDI